MAAQRSATARPPPRPASSALPMRRSRVPATRRHTNYELKAHTLSSLRTIERLCRIYDSGHHYIAFTNFKIFTNWIYVRWRTTKKVPTVSVVHHSHHLLAYHKLISIKVIGADPPDIPHVEWEPWFRGVPPEIRLRDFREWWNRDIIHRASAAKPGVPSGFIPMKVEYQVSLR